MEKIITTPKSVFKTRLEKTTRTRNDVWRKYIKMMVDEMFEKTFGEILDNIIRSHDFPNKFVLKRQMLETRILVKQRWLKKAQ